MVVTKFNYPMMISMLFLLIQDVNAAEATCPQIAASAVCRSGTWQLQMDKVTNWFVVDNKLQDKPCHNEGQQINHLQWQDAFAFNNYKGVMCHYSFEELSHSSLNYDIALDTNSYKVDERNSHWHFDYYWRYRCGLNGESIQECTLLNASQ